MVLAVVAALCCGDSGSVLAQQPGIAGLSKLDATLFAKFDDGDGALTKEEVGEYPWLRYDVDGNGAISKDEFVLGRLQDRVSANLAPSTAGSFALLDWTNDGKLTGAELDGGLWLEFDGDGDKVVDKAEYLAGKKSAPRTSPDDVVPAQHAKLIKALTSDDDRTTLAMLHTFARSRIPPRLMRIYFDMIKSEMGAFTAADAAPVYNTETIEGTEFRRARHRLQYANGPVNLTASYLHGVLAGFDMDSPQLTPEAVEAFKYKRIYEIQLSDNRKDFVREFLPQCEKFLGTLIDVGADGALALLDSESQHTLRNDGTLERLERARRTLGPIARWEPATLLVDGARNNCVEKISVFYDLHRTGKEAAFVEFNFILEGLQVSIINCKIADPLQTPSPAVPAAPAAPAPPQLPAPPRIAPPRTSLPAPPIP
ncbi:MAG: hypothetical protein K8U03_15880 [Planctomycetia bacterium]|nr:hypothetical protein [Planctomycetia bacterium]